jgi:DNA polymerase-3 subunit epsilon
MSWHLGPFLAFDTETSGVDVENDRIVSAAVIAMANGSADATEWMADPGIDIPAEASAIHGISTEHARTHGRPAVDVIIEIVAALSAAVETGTPIVGHNVVFDLTLTDREVRRHLGITLRAALGADPIVIDTMVLDKVACPFRRRVSETQGARQLRTLAETYGLGWDPDAAHGASYDALMAGRIAWHIGHIAHQRPSDRPDWVRHTTPNRFSRLAGHTLDELHAAQITWAQLDAASYQRWLRDPAKSGDKHDPGAVIDGMWPVRLPLTEREWRAEDEGDISPAAAGVDEAVSGS